MREQQLNEVLLEYHAAAAPVADHDASSSMLAQSSEDHSVSSKTRGFVRAYLPKKMTTAVSQSNLLLSCLPRSIAARRPVVQFDTLTYQ